MEFSDRRLLDARAVRADYLRGLMIDGRNATCRIASMLGQRLVHSVGQPVEGVISRWRHRGTAAH